MIRILELFGGIGACSKALERLGIEYEIADYVEIDRYAVKSFNAIHNTNFEPQDICEWNKAIEADLIMHGSPCQDFSLAGKQAGGDEGSGTRSSLMYETIRIVEKLKPKYVIWENVKNLLSKKHRHNFNAYLETMEKLGYVNYYQVLNAKDYGIPQNRERVFTISIRDDSDFKDIGGNPDAGYDDYFAYNFKFPPKQELKLKLKDMLEDEVDEKYYWNYEDINILKTKILDGEEIKYRYNVKVKDIILNNDFKSNEILNIDAYNKNIAKISQTLTTPHNINFLLINNKIRKPIPLEYWRLMGFDDEDFEKASKVNSNNQLYKQAGNSIVVNVLEAILTNLLLDNDNQEVIK